ncbi:hypothetical protein BSFA1_85680 (plasmid) [Burkholderia sp. SFA1]|nr:hypothetical protein BSFA1_85680 [Burkholderia sp. SFA1]
MTQLHLGLALTTKRTRKREFLDEMRRAVPWSRLIELIEPHYPKGKTGRPPFPVATMLHIHFIQQWFSLSDPAMEEALYDVPPYCEFAGLDGAMPRLPDERPSFGLGTCSKPMGSLRKPWRWSMRY